MSSLPSEQAKRPRRKHQMTFVIDADNNITAYANATAPDGAELKLSEHRFGSEKDLATLAGSWPGVRLIEIWNSLPGVRPVKPELSAGRRFSPFKKETAAAREYRGCRYDISPNHKDSGQTPPMPEKLGLLPEIVYKEPISFRAGSPPSPVAGPPQSSNARGTNTGSACAEK